MRRPRNWAGISAILFATSCALPALRGGDGGLLRGWFTLAYGWFPMYSMIPWSANVLALGAWIFFGFGRHRAARMLGVLAAGVAATTWTLYRPTDILVAYYLWQMSLVALAAAAWLASRRRKSSPARARLEETEEMLAPVGVSPGTPRSA
ncbi:hypothetical protein [Paludisphaera rhizosphaerae]|uniref:hypothetical protein n=1 Tax=Paludisphaera rhizosphaerae TaxID=2711216 RepID=UPI0013EB6AA0|nr:hypothetical protein [Paludisphaera rhizosphaerae]